MNVICAMTTDEIRSTSGILLKSILDLYSTLYQKYVEQPVPTYDNLAGTYEELWCNYRNKIIASAESKDASYAFYAAMGAQGLLDEMTESREPGSSNSCSILMQVIWICSRTGSSRQWMTIWRNISGSAGSPSVTILVKSCTGNI